MAHLARWDDDSDQEELESTEQKDEETAGSDFLQKPAQSSPNTVLNTQSALEVESNDKDEDALLESAIVMSLSTEGNADVVRGESKTPSHPIAPGSDSMDPDLFLQRGVSMIESGFLEDVSILPSCAILLAQRWQAQGDSKDLDKAVTFLDTAVELTPDDDPQKPDYLHDFGTLLKCRFDETGELADIHKAILVQQQAVMLTPDENPKKFKCASNAADLFMCRFKRLGDLSDLDHAISFLQLAAASVSDTHPGKPVCLDVLGVWYTTRFERLGQAADMDNAISSQQQALSFMTDHNPQKQTVLYHLSTSFATRFKSLGHLVDMDQAISMQQQSLDLLPSGHPARIAFMSHLGALVLTRFERRGDVDDIERAITIQRQVVELTPHRHPLQSQFFHTLGVSLAFRFERRGELHDIHEAIALHQQAVALLTSDSIEEPIFLNHLGHSLTCRFERLGELDDIQVAISVLQKAVDLSPSGQVVQTECMNNLGRSLTKRFERLGEITDIDKALFVQQRAASLLPEGHPTTPIVLENLAISFTCRFEKGGERSDIESALSVQRQATVLTADDHPHKPNRLANLGVSLENRFEWLGDIADIDQAISCLQQAVTLSSDGDPKKPGRLHNLGLCFSSRFERLGELHDIDSAILNHREAIALTPDGHADKADYLNGLGSSFRIRFERTAVEPDIENAMSSHRLAIQLTPEGHSNMPSRLSNLSASLYSRFERFKQTKDIDEAMRVQKQAIALVPEEHPYKPRLLNNLGNSLTLRFERLNDVADIEEAISIQQRAIALTPDGHANKAHRLHNLGRSFKSRYERSGDRSDVTAAMDAYRKSATSLTGSPSLRFRSAQHWAQLAALCGDAPSLEGYRLMIHLTGQVVWLGNTVHRRYKDIHRLGTAVNEAAAAACAAEKYDLAVEWLEQGRCIVWGQILQLRTPVNRLRDVNPTLALHLQRVAQELEHAGSASTTTHADNVDHVSLEDAAQAHRRLAQEWDDLLEEARSISGFEDFLQPTKLSRLASVVQEGDRTVVVINVDKARCDALVLRPASTDVLHVPLPRTSFNTLFAAYTRLSRCLVDAQVVQRGLKSTFNSGQSAKTIFANIMTMLYKDVVHPIIDCLICLKESDRLPQIVWCLTGPLAFLPIHAAGDYSNNVTKSRIFNHVISSYTPSLTALLESMQKQKHVDIRKSGLLAINQSNSSNHPSLPGALEEVKQLEKQMMGREFKRLDDANGTVDSVLAEMAHYGSVHFACHAIQNNIDPTRSAFILHDGGLELGTIMKKPLPDAQLAYLSACQTATGEEGLPEEALHLAACMFVAGYPSVVATMWSIGDRDAPRVAEIFYHLILGKEGVSVAEALHLAVGELRTVVGEESFLLWVPFIHIGR